MPGPELAALAGQVQRDGLGGLDDDQLTGVLQAANRLGAWSAAMKLAAGPRGRRRGTGGRSITSMMRSRSR